jgi:hypothetical protein
MTRDKIDQLAKLANIDLEHHVSLSREPVWIATPDELAAFTALVLEEAARACEQDHVGESVNDDCDNNGDRAYNLALRHAAASVRAMKPEVK